jgi:hypothetical protein
MIKRQKWAVSPVANAGVDHDAFAIRLDQPRVLRKSEVARLGINELRTQPMPMRLDVLGGDSLNEHS